MAEVRTTFTSDDKEVQKSLAAMQKQMQSLVEENRKLKESAKAGGDALKDEGQAGVSAFSAIGDSIKGVAAGILSATTAAAIFRGELESINRLNTEAAQAQGRVADLQRRAFNNMPGMSPTEMAKFTAGISNASRAENVSPEMLWGAAPGARSATTSPEQTMSNLRVASRYHPTNAGDLEAFAASLGAMEKATGWTGDAGAEANAGVAYKIQGESFVPSAEAVKKYLVKGAGKLRSFGDSVGEAATLMPAATHLLSDAEGANSLTFMSNLASQLQEAMPAEASTYARIQAMQNDPEARAKFLASGQFGQDKVFVEKALTEGSDFDRMIERGVRSDWSKEGMRAFSSTQFANMDAQPLQAAGKFQRVLSSETENKLLEDFIAGDAGRLQESLADLRHKSRVGWAESKARGTMEFAQMAMGADPREVTIGALESWANRVQAGGDKFIGANPKTDALAATLKELVVEMREINNNTAQTKDNTGKRVNIDGNAE